MRTLGNILGVVIVFVPFVMLAAIPAGLWILLTHYAPIWLSIMTFFPMVIVSIPWTGLVVHWIAGEKA